MCAVSLDSNITALLSGYSNIRLGVLFGSIAHGTTRWESDIDLAVAGHRPLTVIERRNLIADLAELTGRSVDLIDLQLSGGVIVREALTRGRLVYCDDRTLYAELIKRMIFEHADFMPYRDRILAERRKAWTSA